MSKMDMVEIDNIDGTLMEHA